MPGERNSDAKRFFSANFIMVEYENQAKPHRSGNQKDEG
jgi:hypothetical protein